MRIRPGTIKSRAPNPAEMAIALGGVLIPNGMPSEHAIVTTIAVEGAESTAAESGTRTAAVPVLLMSDDNVAARSAKPKTRTTEGTVPATGAGKSRR
jgi:hypothetical protein